MCHRGLRYIAVVNPVQKRATSASLKWLNSPRDALLQSIDTQLQTFDFLCGQAPVNISSVSTATSAEWTYLPVILCELAEQVRDGRLVVADIGETGEAMVEHVRRDPAGLAGSPPSAGHTGCDRFSRSCSAFWQTKRSSNSSSCTARRFF